MIKKINNKGFSLIEAIVALGVFALLAATVSSTAGLGYLSEKQSGERIIAQNYSTEAIEAVKSIRERGWSELLIGNHGLDKTSGYWEFNGTEDIIGDYTRQISIASVYRDQDGIIVPEVDGNIDNHTKLITVTVSWALSPSTNNELIINTYLTNWESKDWSQTNWSGGDNQSEYLDETKFWEVSEGIDTETVGEVKLATVGAIPSPYALLMHMDGPRYIAADIIDNNSFSDYSGISPDIIWPNWTETGLGSETDSIPGQLGQAAEISFDWWLGLGGIEQTSIPVEGDTTYQIAFYLKGDISYFSFTIKDDENYYLKSDGDWSTWFSTNYVTASEDWTQFNTSFTTRSGVTSIDLSLSGLATSSDQWFAVDEISLSREVVYDDGPFGNHGYKLPDDNDGPNYETGNFADALGFDGAVGIDNGDAVIIPSVDSLNIVSAITLEAWIYPENIGNDDREIVNKWSWTSGDYRSYRLTVTGADKLEFALSSDGGTGNGHEYTVISGSKINVNEWQHVVGTYNGTEMKVYINSNEEGSTSYNGGIFNSGENSDVMIGSIDNNLNNNHRFEGIIDEVSIESIALSETEVFDHFTNSPLTPEAIITWTSPVPEGTFMVDKKVAGMHVIGDYLYLALLDKKRVEIFDLSTSATEPTSLGLIITTGKSEDVFTYGNYIYVMTDNASPGLEIYQYTSTPIDAVFVGDIDLGTAPSGLWIDGDIMYIALQDNEVEVYSLLADPLIPTSLGSFSTASNTTDITIYADYAYVSLDNDIQAMQVFDISLDPSNPSSTDIVGAIEAPIGITSREGYLFLVTGGASRKVLVYDIYEIPANPAAIGDLDIADNGWDMATRGSYLYIGLGGSSKGVQVFDMTFMLAGGAGQSNYEVYGSLESSAFDTTSASGFNFISWSEMLPSAEENVRVQIKTADTLLGLDSAIWSGASGNGTYYDDGIENIIPIISSHNGDRYIKYMVHLYGSGDDTPVMTDININYTP